MVYAVRAAIGRPPENGIRPSKSVISKAHKRLPSPFRGREGKCILISGYYQYALDVIVFYAITDYRINRFFIIITQLDNCFIQNLINRKPSLAREHLGFAELGDRGSGG